MPAFGPEENHRRDGRGAAPAKGAPGTHGPAKAGRKNGRDLDLDLDLDPDLADAAFAAIAIAGSVAEDDEAAAAQQARRSLAGRRAIAAAGCIIIYFFGGGGERSIPHVM